MARCGAGGADGLRRELEQGRGGGSEGNLRLQQALHHDLVLHGDEHAERARDLRQRAEIGRVRRLRAALLLPLLCLDELEEPTEMRHPIALVRGTVVWRREQIVLQLLPLHRRPRRKHVRQLRQRLLRRHGQGERRPEHVVFHV